MKKYIAKNEKPIITKEDVNKEEINRHLNSDGKQLFIRIPTKATNFLNLKHRQEVTLIIDYKEQTILLNFNEKIKPKTARKSNLNKNKKKKEK